MSFVQRHKKHITHIASWYVYASFFLYQIASPNGKERLSSELRFLKAQINPHFLFKTLNNLYYLAFKQSPNITEVIAKLSQMMRYMNYDSNHPRVPLEKEIGYMSNYIILRYAIEGDELDVTDYLLKPITFERFLKAVEKAGALWQKDHPATESPKTPMFNTAVPETPTAEIESVAPHFIFVKDGTKLVELRLTDIMYIEGLKDYVKIHTPGRNITTLQRLKTLEGMLPADKFIRIHHSYYSGSGVD